MHCNDLFVVSFFDVALRISRKNVCPKNVSIYYWKMKVKAYTPTESLRYYKFYNLFCFPTIDVGMVVEIIYIFSHA